MDRLQLLYLSLVEPEVIVPEDTIYLPQVYREIDLTCSGQEDLPDGGRFSSPGWTEVSERISERYSYSIQNHRNSSTQIISTAAGLLVAAGALRKLTSTRSTLKISIFSESVLTTNSPSPQVLPAHSSLSNQLF